MKVELVAGPLDGLVLPINSSAPAQILIQVGAAWNLYVDDKAGGTVTLMALRVASGYPGVRLAPGEEILKYRWERAVPDGEAKAMMA